MTHFAKIRRCRKVTDDSQTSVEDLHSFNVETAERFSLSDLGVRIVRSDRVLRVVDSESRLAVVHHTSVIVRRSKMVDSFSFHQLLEVVLLA